MTCFCSRLIIETNMNYSDITNRIRYMRGKIKDSINYENLISNPNIYKNENLISYFKNINFTPLLGFFTQEVAEFFDVYGGQYIIKDDMEYKIRLYFYKIKKSELINSELIQKFNNIFKQSYFINNNILDVDYHEYRLSLFLQKLDESKFYNLSYVGNTYCRTRLYNYQRHNISELLRFHNNGVQINFDDDLLMFFDNDIIYNFSQNNFIDKSHIPQNEIFGGIVMDEPGTGKTIQFIVYLLESIKNFTNDDVAIVLTPNNDIKKHWFDEFKKHISNPIESFPIMIQTFTEFTNKINKSINILVIDEIHTLWSSKKCECFDMVLDCNAKYRWGLSATPFVAHDSLFNIIKYLTGKKFKNERIAHIPYIQNKFMERFLKNTKANTKDEYPWPDITINNVKLKFDKIQQDVYDTESKLNASIYNLRLLACQLQLMYDNVSQLVTPKELKEYVNSHYRSLYENEVYKLKELEEQYQNIVLNNMNFKENEYVQRCEHYSNLIKTQKHEVEKFKIAYEYHEKSSNSIIKNFNGEDIDTDDVCIICLCAHELPICYLNNCGHYFCKSCIDASFKYNANNIRCPVCRRDADKFSMMIVNDKTEIIESSKIKYIIEMLKSSDFRIIIFTQFTKIIDCLITKILKTGISIKKFSEYKINTDPNCRVVLLSSEENAAGIDLTEFNRVIIFEPFEDSTYCREIEKQLIGRVHRQGQTKNIEVYRLIIENTIEEKIYGKFD